MQIICYESMSAFFRFGKALRELICIIFEATVRFCLEYYDHVIVVEHPNWIQHTYSNWYDQHVRDPKITLNEQKNSSINVRERLETNAITGRSIHSWRVQVQLVLLHNADTFMHQFARHRCCRERIPTRLKYRYYIDAICIINSVRWPSG